VVRERRKEGRSINMLSSWIDALEGALHSRPKMLWKG
jgi:hypothetical protein